MSQLLWVNLIMMLRLRAHIDLYSFLDLDLQLQRVQRVFPVDFIILRGYGLQTSAASVYKGVADTNQVGLRYGRTSTEVEAKPRRRMAHPITFQVPHFDLITVKLTVIKSKWVCD